MIKKLLGIVILIISFSLGHTAFAVDCFSSCKCRVAYDVIEFGCAWNEICASTQQPNCNPSGNFCCYYELGYCSGSCGTFYFRKCFLDSCNYS